MEKTNEFISAAYVLIYFLLIGVWHENVMGNVPFVIAIWAFVVCFSAYFIFRFAWLRRRKEKGWAVYKFLFFSALNVFIGVFFTLSDY